MKNEYRTVVLSECIGFTCSQKYVYSTWHKGKKAEHLYSALHGIQTTLKRSGMDHTVLPAINTMPAVHFVSVHQMAPPPIEVANI